MKSNLLRTFFEWVLITSVLMSVGSFALYWMKSRDARVAESRLNNANLQVQRTQFVLQALSRDCDKYAETNPDLARLLATMVPSPSAGSTKPKSATR
jgi:hypothetical protein